MRSAKWWMGLLAVAVMAGTVVADEITLKQAETAVSNWIARGGAFGKLATGDVVGETFEDSDTGAKMHVVRVPGRGFAVTSADDGIEPIILFSDGDGEFVPEEGNPVWDLLRWDLAARSKALTAESGSHATPRSMPEVSTDTRNMNSPKAKWASFLSPPQKPQHGGAVSRGNGIATEDLSDIRREPFMKLCWTQKQNSHEMYAYNLFEPRYEQTKGSPRSRTLKESGQASPGSGGGNGNEDDDQGFGDWPCGCVATAGGMIMRFLKWPTASVELASGIWTVLGKPEEERMFGGPYLWDEMGEEEPLEPAQCINVSKLTHDIGVACGADFVNMGSQNNRNLQTGIYSQDFIAKLKSVFGYANASWYSLDSWPSSKDNVQKGIMTCMDAKLPVLLAIKSHAVVVDGCGSDSGEFAIHVNFGWGDKDCNTFWYKPPSLHPNGEEWYTSDFIKGMGYNIFTNGTGSILSGKVTGEHGKPVWDATIWLFSETGALLETTNTASDGVYWFRRNPGTYIVVCGMENDGIRKQETIELKECWWVSEDSMSMGNVLQDFSLPSAPSVATPSATLVATSPATPKGYRTTATEFSSPLTITLSSETPGVEIRYTLDGSQPMPDSALYEGPITIQDTTTLRAVGYAEGMECSEEFTRTWTFVDVQSRDNFSDARPIVGFSGQSSFDTTGYTKESGEPLHSSEGHPGGTSAWAVWTAPESGDWTFYLSGIGAKTSRAMDTQLAVYTGNTVSNLTLVASNEDANRCEEDYSSRVSFHAEKGKVYHIAMDSYNGATYPGTLLLRWKEGYVAYVQSAYDTQWLPVSGGTFEMEIDSSSNWHVEECSDWISPLNTSGKPGDSLVYTISPNCSGDERWGFVTLQSGNAPWAGFVLVQHSNLDFVTTKEAALDAAWRNNKRILLVYGRESCIYTQATFLGDMSDLQEEIDAGFVLWYSNCDRQTDADEYVGSGGSLPIVRILDPLDMSQAVATAWRSAVLAGNANWPGLPVVKIELESVSANSATVTTKVRAWGAGATSAAVTLETADDASFTNIKSTRTLGSITHIWTEQEWTFEPPSMTEAAFCRVKVSSGDWTEVSGLVEFVPLGVALDNGTLTFMSEGTSPWLGQTAVSHDGVDAAQCVNPTMDGEGWALSELKTTVHGPGRLSFWWKADGNASGYFYFRESKDWNSEVVIRETNRTWTVHSWESVNTNDHVLTWGLTRRNEHYYSLTGWVDQVTWMPGNIVTLDQQNGYGYASSPTVLAIRGEPMPTVVVPTKTGYTFGGYYSGTNGTGTRYYTASGTSARTWNRTGNATLYAKWTPKTYNIVLDSQAGIGGPANVTATYGELLPTIAVPAREGYDFGGYYTGTGGSGTKYYNAAGNGEKTWETTGGATLYAHWFEKPAVTWGYRLENGKAIVTNATPARGRLTIPSSLGGYPVSGIGNYAFRNASDLVSISIPAEVTMIGYDAFYGCRSLLEVVLPDSLQTIGSYAFYQCFSLTNLALPNGLRSIGSGAFWGCERLRGIDIPASVSTVGDAAFVWCDALEEIRVDAANSTFASEDGVLFSKDKKTIRSVPNGKMGEYEIPDGVETIGNSAFRGCGGLSAVSIPDSVANIGQFAFYDCDGLGTVTIPWRVTNLGRYVFAECDGLKTASIQGVVTNIDEYAFGYCEELVAINIPDGARNIGDYAFLSCRALSSVTIPDSVVNIGRGAFTTCSSLMEARLGKGVAIIGDYAFSSCWSLTSLTIPNSVTKMGNGMFSYCSHLAFLYVPADWAGTDMLEGAGVPEGCSVVYGVVSKQTVSFNANGGNCPVGEKEYGVPGTYGSLPIATWSGHAFLGWFTKASGGTKVTAASAVTTAATRTLYAHWTTNQVTTFKGNGGKPTTLKTTNTIGKTYGTFPTVTWTNHVLLGWYTASNGGTRVLGHYKVTEEATRTLWAHWTDKQVTTFQGNGGTPTEQVRTNTMGKAYGTFPNVTWANHAFLGWFTAATGGTRVYTNSSVTAAKERTLYAHWTTNQVTTFKGNGGKPTTLKTTNTIGKTYGTFPAVTWTNHVLLGWYTATNGGTRVLARYDVTEEATRTLYARWTDKQVTTFQGNGGTPDEQVRTNTIGKTYGVLPDATWANHAFLGWFTAAAGGTRVYTNSAVTVAKERTLYAHWTTNQVTTFKGNGGTPATLKTTNTIGKTYGTFPTVTWSNHVFLGWYTATNGGTRVLGHYNVTEEATRTLYARWTDKQTTVFQGNGGTPTEQVRTNTMGKAYGTFPNVTWANHAFLGWFTAAEGGTRILTNSTVTVAKARTLYAHWTTNQVTTFKGNGGTPATLKTTNTIGKTYGTFPSVTWTNHVLLGWYTASNGGTRVLARYNVTEEATRTLYARWTDKQVTTFKGNGGTPTEQVRTNTMGKAYGVLPDVTWANHAFLGWYTSASGGTRIATNSTVTVAKERTLYAHWTTNQVTTFKGSGGTPATQKTTNTIGKTYGTFPAVTWTNHVLLGWYTATNGGTRVLARYDVTEEATRTLYARWTDKQTTIFKGNGGTPGEQVRTNTMGKAYGVLPDATWANHAFLGWYTAASGGTRIATNSTVTVAKERTLYAHWTTNQVTTFKGNGGKPTTLKTTNTIGKTYGTFPTVTWTNHVFLGWYTATNGGTRVLGHYNVTEEATRTLYARWTDKQVTTFQGNGGTPDEQVRTNTMGKAYGVLPNVTWANHAFLGWYTAASGGARIATNSTVTVAKERTLYAHWTTNQVTTFKGNGGTPATLKTTNTIGKTYGTFPSVTWTNHVLLGWYTASNGGTRVLGHYNVTEEATRTLYARWTDKQVTTFQGNGGTPDEQVRTNTMGQAYGTFPNVTWANHSFLGWYTAAEGGTRILTNSTVTVAKARTLWAHWREGAKSLSILGMDMEPRSPMARMAGRSNAEVIVLRFEAEAGSIYHVQWTEKLGGEWESILSWQAEADGEAELQVPMRAGEAGTGFYRVATDE